MRKVNIMRRSASPKYLSFPVINPNPPTVTAIPNINKIPRANKRGILLPIGAITKLYTSLFDADKAKKSRNRPPMIDTTPSIFSLISFHF